MSYTPIPSKLVVILCVVGLVVYLVIQINARIQSRRQKQYGPRYDDTYEISPETRNTLPEKIEGIIQDLADSGGRYAFMILTLKGNRYIQFALDSSRLGTFESASDKYLEDSVLSEPQIEQLIEYGFSVPDDRTDNYYLDFEVDNQFTSEELSLMAVNILDNVYNMADGEELNLIYETGVQIKK